MVVVDLGEEAKAIEIRGALGLPNGFGEVYYGWSEFGDYLEPAGFYQRRPRKTGQIIVRMRHYFPRNNQWENQQAWRGVFADGVDAWKALTDEEKLVWKDKKYPRGMLGFHRFMRQYLNAH